MWLVLDLRPKKRGSLEQQLVALAEGLRVQGIGCTYVFAAWPAPWLMGVLSAAEVDVRLLAFGRPLKAAARLGAWLMAARPALVHFHFVRPQSPLVLAAALAGCQVVVNDHVTPVRAARSRLREGLRRARARTLDAVVDRRIAVSRFVAASVVEVDHVRPDRVEVIENGVDLDRFGSASPGALRGELGAVGRPLVVCVSRLAEEKGVGSLLRAMPVVGREAVLALVGDGPMEASFRALAVELGVAARVRFLGVRDDVERIVAGADVVVVPSHWEEAFGLAAVEAMAAGRPVVVTASGAMPEIVGGGSAGLIVPRRDPWALAGAITRVLDDPGLAGRVGRAGRHRARRRYSLERWVQEVCRLYARLCPPLLAVA